MSDTTKQSLRNITFCILTDVLFKNVLLCDAFLKQFDKCSFDERDRSFVEFECKGIIEEKTNIDKIINEYSKVKIKKLDKSIYVLLLIGIYEILYMDKVPDYAAVNETVELAKKITKSYLSSYVNGILRNVERNKSTIYTEKKQKEKRCYFKILNNSIEEVLEEIYKSDIICKKYTGALDFKYQNVYFSDNYKKLLSLASFKNGNILIADASSLFLTDKLADIINSEFSDKNGVIKILDVCAAPGGKTLSLNDNLSAKNLYIKACDISKSKINKILDNIKRLKTNNVDTIIRDATMFDKCDYEKFDVVICDVPCTGLGISNKKPDIKEHYSEEKLDALINIQRKIIDVSCKYLKNNGILSYSTCTTTNEENEDIIKYFIKTHKSYKKIYEKRIGVFDENLSDGFYMCIMKKKLV